MLAMDVVDTLRHHRSIVDAELNEEAREQALIDRVKAIYEAQGIDVPDEVIQKGVEALKQDRFVYKPPRRTLAVRLAEVYVRRGYWTKVVLGIAGVLAAIWGSIAFANHRRDQALVHAFTNRVQDHTRASDAVSRRLDAVARELDALDPAGEAPVIADIASTTRTRLAQARQRWDTWKANRKPLPAALYPDQRRELDKRLADDRVFTQELGDDVAGLEASVRAIGVLRSLGTDVGTAMSMLSGVTISESEQARVEAVRRLAETAIDAGDPAQAKARVAELTNLVRSLRSAEQAKRSAAATLQMLAVKMDALPELAPDVQDEVFGLRQSIESNIAAGRTEEAQRQLRQLAHVVGVLDQAYELRIVSRPGESTGITRADGSRGRNHYIQVEAVGPDGRVLELDFKNEEDQVIVKAKRIAIRVPNKVYEQVRADKSDNGIVDNSLFGVKRRGQRTPTYHFETAGGWIRGE